MKMKRQLPRGSIQGDGPMLLRGAGAGKRDCAKGTGKPPPVQVKGASPTGRDTGKRRPKDRHYAMAGEGGRARSERWGCLDFSLPLSEFVSPGLMWATPPIQTALGDAFATRNGGFHGRRNEGRYSAEGRSVGAFSKRNIPQCSTLRGPTPTSGNALSNLGFLNLKTASATLEKGWTEFLI